MNIFLVRHGETDLNLQNRIQGQIDAYDLNSTGLLQVKALAERIKTLGLKGDGLVSSPLKRASQTAHFIADALSLPVNLDTRLMEINCGDYEGQNIDVVKALIYDVPLIFKDALNGHDIIVRSGNELRDYYQSPDPRYDLIAHPAGETKRIARDRAIKAITHYITQYSNQENIWVVTHSTIIKLILSAYAPHNADQKINCADVISFDIKNGDWIYKGKI